ncbi:MAG: DUF393 domain-containing protein [Chitinophagales bacterium]|nr:DUF393 domain-containing protein [Chitinophagales bacterium]
MIALYDGYCNLCSSSVQFILKHERAPIIKFAALQSEIGGQLKSKYNIDPEYSDSFILIEKDTAFFRSDAALRTCKYLKGVLRIAPVFLIFPRIIRDSIYNRIAASRYSLFGKKDRCWIPSAEIKNRFLDI